MNNKRRHILCILILIMTSLFLSSCGEPSLCTLSGIDITKYTVQEDKKVAVKINGSDTDLSKLSNGPGVIFCYCFGDATFEGQVSDAVTPFANLVKTKLIIDYDNNSKILTFDNTDLFAFERQNSKIGSPTYCYNLYGDISGTSINNKILTLEYEDNRQFDLNGDKFYTKELPDDVTGQYIYIYAAFSAEEGSFSNNYWSKLVYLGRVGMVGPTT